MARKKKHEEHVNHEAWAIPYGDLVTLLFALFTVMYAMSSVNEGKFRVLSDAMIAAFNGAPKSMRPVNMGEPEPGKGGDKPLIGITPTALIRVKSDQEAPAPPLLPKPADIPGSLIRMEREVQDAMRALIDAKLITVKRESMWLEIEINTDILFPSGSGAFSSSAEPVLDKLAEVLKPFPNPIRVEGHTDDRPIHTSAFPSNWELSAARAASVVHQFTKQGIDPLRLEIVGFGEFHPRQPNASAEGRNANRRVAVLVLEAVSAAQETTARITTDTPESVAPGVDLADGGSATNRLMVRVPPDALERTVLMKQVKPTAVETATEPPKPQ
ncbi:MAG TPA: flagellar motor protein MotD [Steroidobacteraceae bacterium]|jgi:chemotaxis protein MotB|nr:flagellar motor protein MotD [Steroidobacteraceae bacterium]